MFALLLATPESSLHVYLPACPARTLACPERLLLHTNARFLRTSPCVLSCAITFSSTPSALTAHFRRLRAVHAQPLLASTALFTRNRCFHGFSLPPSSPVGEPAKLNPSHASAERNNLRSTAATLPKSKKWGYTECASLLAHVTDVPALKQRFLDYDLPRAAVSPERRGRQGIRLTTSSETCSVTFQHYDLMLRVHPVL